MRQLERVDARGNLRVAHHVEMLLIQPLDGRQRVALHQRVHPLGIGKIEDWIADAAEHDPLVHRGQKARAPVGGAAARPFGAGGEDDERGQVLRFAAQAVSGPGAEAGPPQLLRAGAHDDLARGVVESVGVHGLDEGEVVRDFSQARKKLREFGTRLSMFGELELGAEQGGVWVDEGGAVIFDQICRGRFAVPLGQLRLVVEQLQVAWRASHKQEDDALGFGGKMRLPGRERIRDRQGRSPAVFAEQLPEGDGAQPNATLLEEPAPRHQLGVLTPIKVALTVHLFLSNRLIQIQQHA